MNKVQQMTESLVKVLFSDIYQFEIGTEDIVFGFNKTLRKRTNSLAKAIKLQVKLVNDCGRMISDTVQIKSVRFYKNGELRNEIRINQYKEQ